jgi:hypothetical protein
LKKVEPVVVVAYSVVSFVLEKKEQMVAQLLCNSVGVAFSAGPRFLC